MSDISVGAVGAALVAGLISFLSLVIGKEQKISEFRQAWIEDLRKCLIGYLVNINALSDLIQLEQSGQSIDMATKLSRIQSLNEASHGIVFRINRKEKFAKSLLKSMSDFDSIAQNNASMTPDRIRVIEKAFIHASTKLLKFEWKRVKRGEITFVLSKVAFAAIIISALTYAGITSWREGQVSRPTVQPIIGTLPFFVR